MAVERMSCEFDLIFGIHSIAAALNNPRRVHQRLVATEEGVLELQKKHQINARKLNVKLEVLASHALQEAAKKLCSQLDVEFTRVPSGIFLQTSELETYSIQDFLSEPESRLIALDQITDVHNGAAILRTAAFYGINGVIIPSEKSFGLTPSFYRIASGATESVKLVRVNSLSRAVGQLNDAGILTVGLSEHSSENLSQAQLRSQKTICLLLGAEETGLSNAVARLVQKNLSLPSQGQIKSLNVSSAAAIAMEKCFGV
jgi:23S rRNA (guanosine2251-2'-O)-methyltransferase